MTLEDRVEELRQLNDIIVTLQLESKRLKYELDIAEGEHFDRKLQTLKSEPWLPTIMNRKITATRKLTVCSTTSGVRKKIPIRREKKVMSNK